GGIVVERMSLRLPCCDETTVALQIRHAGLHVVEVSSTDAVFECNGGYLAVVNYSGSRRGMTDREVERLLRLAFWCNGERSHGRYGVVVEGDSVFSGQRFAFGLENFGVVFT